jgi:chemotaxis protein CheX
VSVFKEELRGDIQRGQIYVHTSAYTKQEVTVLIGVTGQIQGIVLYELSTQTACKLAGLIACREFDEFDELAQSGVAELGNVITGTAGTHLSEAGFTTSMSPPTLLVGTGTMVSTIDLPRLVIPLQTSAGAVDIHVALQVKETTAPAPH